MTKKVKVTASNQKMKTQLLFLLLLLSLAHFSAQISAEHEHEQEDVKRSQFPDGFFFGTSTSAYQIEGAFLEDGKGFNNWDVFSHISGSIQNNENGDVAENHYHRFLEDIEIMHSLGVNSYRFSISWARVLPRGRFGKVNPNGVMFYNKIIDNLVLRGIEPFVTIHHHDIPQELEDRYKTWLSPQIQEDFVHFANVCFTSFGDRVKYWTTLNEPNLYNEMAYIRGRFPPARCSLPFGDCPAGDSDKEPLVVMHNMILSHAKAVNLYRHHFQKKHGGFTGIIANTFMYEPYADDEFNRQAVARALAFNVAWLLDPIVHGEYPPEMRQYHGSELPRFSPEETMFVKGSLDFVGINHYSTLYAKDCIHSRSACNSSAQRPIRGFVDTTGVRDGVPIGEPTGMERFFVVPGGLEKTVDYVKDRYNNMPMFVTENGYSPAAKQNENLDDLLQDEKRVEFHKAYLAALARSIRKGADVRGYYVWSLMDNFEWVQGYSMRFGLYHVDRRTLKRTPKLSAKWYRSFLTNCTMNTNQLISNSEEGVEIQIQ